MIEVMVSVQFQISVELRTVMLKLVTVPLVLTSHCPPDILSVSVVVVMPGLEIKSRPPVWVTVVVAPFAESQITSLSDGWLVVYPTVIAVGTEA
jgi:hypothetical protein